MKLKNEIKSTTNYDQFSFLKGNRHVRVGNKTQIIDSILKDNRLSSNPIVVNEKMEIIDGQHRFEACRELGLPIFYIIEKGADLSTVRLLNSRTQKWNVHDYLESNIQLGLEDYSKLKRIQVNTGVPLGTLVRVLAATDGVMVKTNDIAHDYMEGRFQIHDLKRKLVFIETIRDLSDYSRGSLMTHREFWKSCASIYERYPTLLSQVTVKLAETGMRLVRDKDRIGYIRQFEDILNKGRTGERLRLE